MIDLTKEIDLLFKELKQISVEHNKDVSNVWDDYKRVENSFFIYDTMTRDYHYFNRRDNNYYMKVANTLGMIYDCGGLRNNERS